MRKMPEITEKTKNNIISAFCKLYQEKPIEKIYVKDVIEMAGYNRSTFYQYFNDIYALLDYVEKDVIETISSKASDEKRDAKDLLKLFEEKEEYLKALLGTYGSMHFIDRIKNEMLKITDIQLLQFDEQLQPYIAEYHIYTTISIFRLWLARGKDIKDTELFGLIHILYSEGIKGLGK